MAQKKKTNTRKQSEKAAFIHMNKPLKERKPMAKFGEMKEVTVKGVKYKLVHPGVRKVVQMQTTVTKADGSINLDSLYEEYMKNVIHEPKVNWDYFEEKGLSTLREVMNEVDTFLAEEDEEQEPLQEQSKE
ncbi:hypothetical protein BAME_38330 [Bacillus sp. M 2-6]|nr:hypothetical protein BAME_38330 [Bacillus sp. M 2-6]RAU04237.1 hypothetical protein DEJ55_11175 [Bacillus pumilus]